MSIPMVGATGSPGGEREIAEAAAKLDGVAEALSVLHCRGPAERQLAAEYAAELLAREVQQTDWRRAGLPSSAWPGKNDGVPIGHEAIIHLARTAMSLHCSGLPAIRQADLWARLTAFFTQIVPASDPRLGRLRERALKARIDAEDAGGDVVVKLLWAYQRHACTDGHDAYITGVARGNLAIAYCQRGAVTDLSEAVRLCRREARARTDRYGTDHPFTLVARSLLVRCLLAQAEAAEDRGERLSFAREAFDGADRVRAARDRMFGVLSVNATLSRRYQGHALFLLGDFERARACLQYALAFDTARNGNREWLGSGPTYLLLARVYRALGDRSAALTHARNAWRLLAADAPGGPSRRTAEALLRELERGSLS